MTQVEKVNPYRLATTRSMTACLISTSAERDRARRRVPHRLPLLCRRTISRQSTVSASIHSQTTWISTPRLPHQAHHPQTTAQAATAVATTRRAAPVAGA